MSRTCPPTLVYSDNLNLNLSGAFSGIFTGNGAGLTNIPNWLGNVTNNETGVTLNGTFSGNGAGLTNLNASQVNSIANISNNANYFIGANTGNPTVNGSGNTAVGDRSLYFLSSGYLNTAVGDYSLDGLQTGSGNTAFGAFALSTNLNASGNTGLGNGALSKLTAGNYNIAMGYSSGDKYEGTESNNIVIGNEGVPGDNNIIRLGTGQTAAYIAGVLIANGAGLTNIPTTSLAGLVPPSDLPTNVLYNFQSGVTLSGTFTGSGAGLTNLSTTNLIGLIPPFNLPANLLYNGQGGLLLSSNCTNCSSCTNCPTLLSLTHVTTNGFTNGVFLESDGHITATGNLTLTNSCSNRLTFFAISGATNNNATNNDPATSVVLTSAGDIAFTGNLYGNGGALTNLNAANLTGALPAASLPAGLLTNGQFGVVLSSTSTNANALTSLSVTNGTTTGVTIDNGGNIALSGGITALGGLSVGFANGNTNLGVAIDSIGDLTASGTISGNGAGLTSINASQVLSIADAGDPPHNYFIGPLAGNSTVSGVDNTAIGDYSLYQLTSGADNTANGFSALSDNSTGSQNTATGATALGGNTTGSQNTAIGAAALATNATGSQNTAAGAGALYSNHSGSANTAGGYQALLNNTSFNNNTAYGASALGQLGMTTGRGGRGRGGGNIALGSRAGYNFTSDETFNIDIGNEGMPGEDFTIRIGDGQTATYLAGTVYAASFQSDANGDFVAGQGNTATGGHATVAGGEDNTASVGGSTVGGGHENTASGVNAGGATVGGGDNNNATGDYSTVPGGQDNTAGGAYSFAAGVNANAQNDWAFVWNGDPFTITTSTADYQFMVRASGGVIFYSSGDNTAGVSLAAGSGSWSTLSDRNAKDDLAPVTPQQVLDKVAGLPINQWSYKTEQGVRHIGPMAQDFYAAFGVGEDDKHITTVDEEGVALAAIQGLNQKLNEKDAEIATLKEKAAKVDSLEKRLADLEHLVQSLAEKK